MMVTSRTYRASLLVLVLLIAACAGARQPGRVGRSDRLFTVVAPDARTVAVAGSFNRWDPSTHPLSGPDLSGRWTVVIPLPPGRYEYLFVVDDKEWVTDPPALSVEDGMGGRNSLLIVPGTE